MFPIETFTAFVSGAPLAGGVGSSDMLALIQGGKTVRLPVTSLPGVILTPIVLAPTTLITSAATYSVVSGDYFIGVNKSPISATTIHLPGAPGVGRTLIIKDVAGTVTGAAPITIDSGTIDGNAGWVLPFAYSCIGLQAVGGTNWSILFLRPG